MKILFAIQGTGNGHISRAREIVPLLQAHGDVDLLVSGSQADVSLTQPLKYRFHGFSYVFGKKGGIDYWKTFKAMDMRQLYKDMRSIPLQDYDLIINDFEPITAWACRLKKVKSVSLSHQASFLSPKTPRPAKREKYAELILKYYAPTTNHIGFHFKPYDSFIYSPVIRSEIRDLNPQNKGYYTVYLPAVDDKLLLQYLHAIPNVTWQIFSKHQKTPYTFKNVLVKPIENESFNKSLENCAGLLTGGGFEGPSEALYLGKKVLMIPMKNQFEQECNAEAARLLGVSVVKKIDLNFVNILKDWINSDQKIAIDFPNQTQLIVNDLIEKFGKVKNQ
ncbi:glycosyl transferase [Pedobacter sp. SD-b]|uniref:Glycosyl transferase n=1 Tax=Pedobacter segetis TaxID=2793069 RepID=A0ABS1BH82_9SPHI|nr:glycosyltransferase family protein [Pedobacter segetis]MBK0382182.1 glycosyl transferase [Pedobacter segetis]